MNTLQIISLHTMSGSTVKTCAKGAAKAAVLGAVWGLATASGSASPVLIANPGFEDPVQSPGSYTYGVGAVPGWTSPSGAVGVWNPTGWEAQLGPVPEGTQVGFLQPGSASQTLADTVQPDTTYTLSIAVGGRLGYNPGTDYSVALLGGTNVLASVSPVAVPDLAWWTLTATYTTPGVVTPGEFLGILIQSGSGQLEFDDIRLDAKAASSTVPDGGSVGWVGALGLVAFNVLTRRQRSQLVAP